MRLPSSLREVRLSPPRDTGILLGGQPVRRRRRGRGRLNPATLLAVAVGLTAVVAAGVLLAARSDGKAAGSHVEPAPSYTLEVIADPTPVFASYRSLQLRLPVRPEEVTAIGFHQAFGDLALEMESLAPDADMRAAANGDAQLKPAARPADDAAGSPSVITGSVLRMWRSNRSGAPDTAADVGGAPGTTVVSPVTGEVVAVREYMLYGKHRDYEVHIQPDGWAEVDVVLIHVDGVRVKEGDRVEAGATAIAEIRKLSHRVDHQLSQYTGDGGDHVHLQLNKVSVPGKLDGVGGS